MLASTVICTVGTSLLHPNLDSLKLDDPDARKREIAKYYAEKRWSEIAAGIKQFRADDRLCGAEINSLESLFAKGYAARDCNLFFCHSDTEEGRAIANILCNYFKDHPVVEVRKIKGLQDSDPKLFRTKGLRNLAKMISELVRNYSPEACAINATGGYKAQIAIGVLIGQALGVPVYYKHERFNEIIAFPPMPISFDYGFWMAQSGLLSALDREGIVAWDTVESGWDERLEALVERESIDGREYLELSPTGQIFHQTFQGRFQSERDRFLPPPVSQHEKKTPRLSGHNWADRDRILRFMKSVVNDTPYVKGCVTDNWNPDLPSQNLFCLRKGEVEGAYSNGSWTVKLIVETSATTQGQLEACVADLNSRLGKWV